MKTEMVYYRDIIGKDCRSLHGADKILRDRTSVKLDAVKTAAKIIAPVAIPLIGLKMSKKMR